MAGVTSRFEERGEASRNPGDLTATQISTIETRIPATRRDNCAKIGVMSEGHHFLFFRITRDTSVISRNDLSLAAV